jgi:hypothetical protein
LCNDICMLFMCPAPILRRSYSLLCASRHSNISLCLTDQPPFFVHMLDNMLLPLCCVCRPTTIKGRARSAWVSRPDRLR